MVLSADWNGLEPSQVTLSRCTIMMRRRHKLISAILGFIVLAVAVYLKRESNPPSNLGRIPPASPGVARAANPRVCIRVIDGDTIELENGDKVRYIGIDAPEIRRREGNRWVLASEPFSRAANRHAIAPKWDHPHFGFRCVMAAAP